jgi:hypothetical protein
MDNISSSRSNDKSLEIDSKQVEKDFSKPTNKNERQLPTTPNSQDNKQIVSRYDAVEFYIDHTEANANYLSQHFFPDFVEAIRIGLGGYTKPDLQTRFSTRPKQIWKWRYRITAGSAKVEIFGPGFQFGQFERITRQEPPKKIRDHLFPSWSEILEHLYRGYCLGVIRITNTLKLNYTIYQDQVEGIVREIKMRK